MSRWSTIRRLLFVLAILTAIPLVARIAAVGPFARPMIRVSKLAQIHLETDQMPGTTKATLPVENDGTATLDFSVEASCACVSLDPRSGRIPPGEKKSITFHLRVDRPGTTHAQILIRSNDPHRSLVQISASARYRPPMNTSPTAVDFGCIERGKSVSIGLRIQKRDGSGFRSERDLEVTTDSTLLSSWLQADVNGIQKLHISLSGEAPKGRFTSSITLCSIADNYCLEVPVAADVEDPIFVTPSVVELEMDPVSKHLRPIPIMVWRRDGLALDSLLSTELPPGLTLSELSSSDGFRRRFELQSARFDLLEPPFLVHLRFHSVEVPATVRLVRSGLAQVYSPTKGD